MAFSLSMLRHRMGARRERMVPPGDVPPRGEGPLLWVHFCPGAGGEGTALVVRDLVAERKDLIVIASGEADGVEDIAMRVQSPPETRSATRAFLNLWDPDAIVFSGPDPHPVLWLAAQSRGIPLVAVEADPARHPIALVRPLAQFDFVHARAPDARLSGRVHALVPLAATPPPPAAIESDLEEMSEVLATRPVWLAAEVPGEEIETVLEAQTHAAKLSHRLLLILELAEPEIAPALVDRLREEGREVALRSQGDNLEPDTEILIADERGEIGLWARLASLTYLGGSLGQGAFCDPMIPAALGSVVLHGPAPGAWGEPLDALDRTNGACRIADGGALGPMVETCLAPDLAAEIAHEAWDIATRGAEASNLTLAALGQALDRAATRRAAH
ncbi:hypothetical protein [Palleronia sp. LCG004]|uniref:3-deoxy-D-manno-octulosonic acid transferase n=1 Tax=Palleronia sp. LCG004 TaxID=3079304 RepID=UPI002943805C|nr:hypothetical protein [Palleronia sp. LCG004]WOI56153.1 hypothetical protein RVY76_14155 [Palleronia sp. LCG004]